MAQSDPGHFSFERFRMKRGHRCKGTRILTRKPVIEVFYHPKTSKCDSHPREQENRLLPHYFTRVVHSDGFCRKQGLVISQNYFFVIGQYSKCSLKTGIFLQSVYSLNSAPLSYAISLFHVWDEWVTCLPYFNTTLHFYFKVFRLSG